MKTRLLGPAETNMWFANRNATLNISIGSPLVGEHVSFERFTAAVQQVSNKNPMLRCSIKLEPLRFDADTGIVDIWHERGDIDGRIEVHLNTPFDEDHGLCRFELLERENGSQAIVISFHHSVGDGGSGNIILRDFALALNGQILPVNSGLPPTWEEFLGRNTKGWRGLPGFFRTLRWLQKRRADLGKTIPNLRIDFPENTKRAVRFFSLELSEEESAKLVRNAKKNDCTVQGLLTASIATALQPEMNESDGAWTFVSPVDMRNRVIDCPDNFKKATQLIASTALCAVNPKTQDFWEMAHSATAQIKEFIEHGHSEFIAPYPSQLFSSRKLFPTDARGFDRTLTFSRLLRKNSSVLLTNMGFVGQIPGGPSDQIKLGPLHGSAAPSIVADIVHGAATHAGKMIITISYNSPQISEARMELYRDRLQACLLAA